MPSERVVSAAGGVVWRKRAGALTNDAGRPSVEVLVIHRPAYDDWTFPKGKVDPGEALPTTAVREIAEETGLRVRLGAPLTRVTYPVNAGTKVVDYWSARPVGGTDAPFEPNKEVDELRWLGLREARDLLTYEHDREVLAAFRTLCERQGHRSRTLVVLRHGKAVPRADHDGDDLERPLTALGAEQARAIVPILAAYGVRRVVTSPAVRCAQTVEPFAHSISTFLEIDDRLAEDTTARQVERSVAALTDRKKPVVLCSHRPTLPWILAAAGADVSALGTGEAIVVHHRKGAVVATEKLP